jgi:hypothetical protein
MIYRNLSGFVFVAVLALTGATPSSAVPSPLTLGATVTVTSGGVAPGAQPQVGVFPDGGFVVVWTSAPAGGVTALQARLFDAGGAPQGEAFRLLPGHGSQAVTALAASGDGSFLVVWDNTDWHGVVSVRGARFDRQGSLAAGPIQINPAGPFSSHGGRLALDATGDLAVAWTGDEGLPENPSFHRNAFARRFDAALAPLGDPFLVEAGEGSGNADAIAGAIAGAPDGSVWVMVDIQGDGFAVSARHLSAAGVLLGTSDPVSPTSTGQEDGTLILASNDALVVAWSDDDLTGGPFTGSRVLGFRYTAAGRRLNDGAFLIDHRGRTAVHPLLVPLPAGDFLTVWTDLGERQTAAGAGVLARRFGNNGAPLGPDAQIGASTSGTAPLATSLTVGGGSAVAVWLAFTGSGGAEILARRLSF